ncbi:MAG TPA: DUF1207 domain-containing protein [Candidatus Binatia bacterium]|nr:DUF1207 domain-containing protein [Candidatus Binatia bacterium]
MVRRSVPGSVVLLWLVALAGAAAAAPSDEFIRGYAAAVLAERFGRPAASVRVQDGVVTAVVEGLSEAERSALQEALARVPGVAGIELRAAPAGPGSPPVTGRKPDDGGPGPAEPTWRTGLMPGGLLFRPLIADPRWPHFSAALQRYLDDPDFRHVASVSFGETFAVYRAALGRGWWEAGIQAAVFSIFDLDADSTDLINADYFVAGVLGYRLGGFSALGRLFHQSSHLGDEFLLRRSRVERINLSYEGVDGKVSYEAFGDVLRLYAGAGYLIRREPDTVDPWSLQYGVEFRSPWPGRGAAFRPIAAADVQYREANDFSADLSIRAGVQFAGVLASRDVQLLLEYFNGRSPNGQFYRRKIDYLGIGVHFHF